MKIEPIKLNPNFKMISSGIFYVTFFVFVTYLFLYGSIKEIKKTSLDIIDKKAKTEFYFESIKSNQDFSKKMGAINNKIKTIDGLFIIRDKEIDFIKTVEDLASNRNVKQSISIDNVALDAKNKYRKVAMDLSVSGSFEDVMNYIADIESLKYYININFVSFSTSIINNNLGDLNAPQKQGVSGIIKTETYWQ